MRLKVKDMVFGAIFAAIYVLLTMVNPLGYGMFQFRVSEVFLMLPFWDRRFITPCIFGVVIANMFSPMGIVDVVTGLIIAVIAYFLLGYLKSKIVIALAYSLLCGVMVGAELFYVMQTPFILSAFSVTVSQMVITLMSIPLWNKLVPRLIGLKS